MLSLDAVQGGKEAFMAATTVVIAVTGGPVSCGGGGAGGGAGGSVVGGVPSVGSFILSLFMVLSSIYDSSTI